MSTGEMAYLAFVLIAFATFIVSVGFVSVWSRMPARDPKVSVTPADGPDTRDASPVHRPEVRARQSIGKAA